MGLKSATTVWNIYLKSVLNGWLKMSFRFNNTKLVMTKLA